MPTVTAANLQPDGCAWNVPRVVIGAPHGHSGKTTISIGLVGALRQRGVNVQPFKKGPDYIDPSWLGYAAGRPCRNLDCYWMTAPQIWQVLAQGSSGADIVIIEGAMGLFDGVDLQGTGSTAQIARITQSPVILVIDTTRMTRSIAPLVLGFMHFDPEVKIGGIILNKVARARHEAMLRAVIKEYCGIPVLGAIPKNVNSFFPERHLGLVPAAEHQQVQEAVGRNIEIAAKYLDLPAIIELARTAPSLPTISAHARTAVSPMVKIGVVRDQAFTFYYPENLEALIAAGAELVYIDSMKNQMLPPIDGLYIGGGFPEVFGEAIEANFALRRSIRRAAEQGMPIYAECGGLMYLGRKILWGNREFEMCGVLPIDVVMEKRPQGHGYTLMTVERDNPFFMTGTQVKGHEFHHSKVINIGDGVDFVYRVERGFGINGQWDGILYRNTFAAYNHIHAVNNTEWAQRFVAGAAAYRKGRKAG
ncbi:cobyrinate a,c-diamide synthase [Sporolituus thermophilus]|uniref:Cobyrinate a,c-diamide synthase n=1 Tax=Sporolituus thermophilus DSM 23256 TaxID=1123285 RepID=A0A1G7I6S7_9FIRM|nr:cobyrinate a,c-diamide synthase [Sporolituus thermophilus]SDF08410.1 cobyrinic acid a,c-diamide synthase [Sporolituus thermophilus DSM 23256]